MPHKRIFLEGAGSRPYTLCEKSPQRAEEGGECKRKERERDTWQKKKGMYVQVCPIASHTNIYTHININIHREGGREETSAVAHSTPAHDNKVESE